MNDETPPPPVVQAAVKSHLLSNLEKARAAKAIKDAERRADKEAEKAVERTEMRKPGEPSGAAEGPSLEKVEELAAIYPRVSVDIRQIIGNAPKSLHDNYIVETKELFAFNQHLIALGGGGLYKCRVRDPDNLGQLLMTFRTHINAPPKPPVRAADPAWSMPIAPPMGVLPEFPFVATPPPQATQLPTATTPTPQDPNVQYPPGQPPVPAQYRSLPVDQQWAYYFATQAQQQRPGGVYSADQIAMHQNQQLLMEKARLEADRATLQARFEAQTRETETKLNALKADLERAREDERKRADRLEMELREAKLRSESDKRDAEHKAEMAALRASIEKITSTPAPPPPVVKEDNFLKYLPLIQEWMRGNASKDEAERARSAENLKLMLTLTKKDPGIESEAMKYMVEILKSRADEKVAATESQVMMIGAISNFIKEQQGEAPPMWLGIAEQLIDGLKGTLVGAAAAGQQMPALPAGTPAPAALNGGEAKGEIVTPSLDEQRAIQQWQQFKSINEEVAKMTFMAYQSPLMPPEMHTSEWRLLIFNLHMRHDIDKLSYTLADHLEHQRTFGMLPAALKPVFEKPAAVLEPILKALPIGQIDKVYTQEFLDAIVKEITDRETERIRVEREDQEEETEEVEGEVVADA